METLRSVAKDVGATLNQVILAWMMHQDILPIIGASRVEQIEENLGALSLKLSGEQMETLTKAGV